MKTLEIIDWFIREDLPVHILSSILRIKTKYIYDKYRIDYSRLFLLHSLFIENKEASFKGLYRCWFTKHDEGQLNKLLTRKKLQEENIRNLLKRLWPRAKYWENWENTHKTIYKNKIKSEVYTCS